MKKVNYIIGKKTEIPVKYLPRLFELMKENYIEILGDYPPKLELFKRSWSLSSSIGSEMIYLLALNDCDEVIGYGYASYNTKFDNTDKGYFWVHVSKSNRKQGLGTTIMKKLVDSFPEKITIINSEGFVNTFADQFLTSIGMNKAYTEVLSISELSKFDKDKVSKEAISQKEKALEKGYDIVFFEDLDYMTKFQALDFVKMVEEIWNDMPIEELTYDKEQLPLSRFQDMNQREIIRGYKMFNFVPVHIESGKPIGITKTMVNQFQPEIGIQEDTGILREHRGNGLGLAIKYQMLNKLLQDTNVKFWRTGNAGSNEHMLRINKILRYEPFTKIGVYETKRSEIKK